MAASSKGRPAVSAPGAAGSANVRCDGGANSTASTAIQLSPILMARLEYAARGWWTFPVPTDGAKKSLKNEERSGTRWGATIDPDVIRADFTSHRFRNQNVGIMCGVESGIFVIETDNAEHGDGIDGEAALKNWEAEHGSLPDTLTARSPSGSLHRFFNHPGPGIKVKSFNAILGEHCGVDCKADGGMVIGVPSVMPARPAKGNKPAKVGGTYVWINAGQAVADAPTRLLDLVIETPKQPTISQKALAFVKAGRAHAGNGERVWANAALDKERKILANTPPGDRNRQLNKSAFNLGQIVGGGALSETEVYDALMQAARANGAIKDDGIGAFEKSITSGLKDGKVKPRKYADKMGCEAPASTSSKKMELLNDVLTEDLAALRFVDLHADALRFCHSSGAWYHWNGMLWHKDQTGLAFHWMRELARRLSASLEKDSRYIIRKASFAASVERFAKSDPRIAVVIDYWDSNPLLVGTPKGTIDLKTGSMRCSLREDGITKSTSVAPDDRAECPRWLQFLHETTGGDVELIRFLQQWCGYCLTGLTREHALVFVYGPGGNGKSVFLNVVVRILKDYAVTAAMDTFTASQSDRHPTDLAMLRGARLVTASETEDSRAWAEARIKQLTGGDRISARFMRQDFFEFLPQFKLTIIGNFQPVLRNVDDAARRRFNIVPFLRKPVIVDKGLEAALLTESAGILRWFIEGCLDWQANGLIRPATVKAATEAYFSEQDLFGQWLEDCCTVTIGDPKVWARQPTCSKAGPSMWSRPARPRAAARRSANCCRSEDSSGTGRRSLATELSCSSGSCHAPFHQATVNNRIVISVGARSRDFDVPDPSDTSDTFNR